MPERARRIMSFLLAALAVFAVGRVLIAYGTRPSRWSTRFALPAEGDPVPASSPLSATTEDIAAIAMRRATMVSAIRSLDIPAYASHFASDAVAFTIGGNAIVGSEALAEALHFTLREAKVVAIGISSSDRRPLGERVFEDGTFHIHLRRGEADVLSKGRFAALWKREGGEWRIVFEAVRGIGNGEAHA